MGMVSVGTTADFASLCFSFLNKPARLGIPVHLTILSIHKTRTQQDTYPKFPRLVRTTSSRVLSNPYRLLTAMRVASSLFALTFLGVAAAGVVPDIATRNALSGASQHATPSISGRSPPPASHRNVNPTSVHSVHPISRWDANPSFVHSAHPISRRAYSTGGHPSHSGSVDPPYSYTLLFRGSRPP